MQNLQTFQQQQSLEQSVIRRINKEIQQEQLNKESRIILIPPTNENYHCLKAFYIVKEDNFQSSNLKASSHHLAPQLQQQERNIDQQYCSNEKYIYSNCVLEVRIIIPKTYPYSNPRFKFPQQPYHPSFKNETICCGISCQFKKNWEPTQTIFTGIDTYCRSILSIPNILMNEKNKIDLTRDCNFEIVSQINNDKQQFLDKCQKWAAQKGNLLNYTSNQDFCQYLNRNYNHPLVKEVLDKIQKIKDRRIAHQLIMLENNQLLNKSLTISMIQQMLKLTQKPDSFPTFNKQKHDNNNQ